MSTSTPTLLRYEDAVARVREAVAGREDTVYEGITLVLDDEDVDPDVAADAEEVCAYLDVEQKPSCIIGQAFALDIVEVGVTPLSEVNQDSAATLFNQALKDRYAVTRKAARFLAAVQNAQDSGDAWGASIESAIEAASYGYDDVEPFANSLW